MESDLVSLVVLGCEKGGRWNSAALELLDKLAHYRSKDVPALLRRSVELSWKDRWAGLICVAVQDALAASLLAPHGPGIVLDQPAAPAPELDILLDGQRWAFEELAVVFD